MSAQLNLGYQLDFDTGLFAGITTFHSHQPCLPSHRLEVPVKILYFWSFLISVSSGIGQKSTYITNHPSSSGKVIHKHQTAERRVFWKASECYFPLIGSSAYPEKFFLIQVLRPRSVKEQWAENLPDWKQFINSWILIKSTHAYKKWEHR